MKNAEFTKKVPLELLCILLLEERDMYGYEMVQAMKNRSDGILAINVTTLYLALKRLNEDHYISMYYAESSSARERSRIYYHLEPSAAAYKDKLEEDYRRVLLGVDLFIKNTAGGHSSD